METNLFRSTVNNVCLLFVLLMFCSGHSFAEEKVGIFSDWRSSPVDFSNTQYKSKISCESLRSWSVEPAQVLLAELVDDKDGLPEYCDVLGHIQTNIKFRMFIPTAWNGRFFMVGNGGLAGDDLLQPQFPQHLNKMKAAIRHGFATVMTDSGHSDKEQPGGSFAYNNFDLEMDYAFRAIHIVSETAKLLISYAYGRSPEFAYFDGCSGGGRQGLMSVQRYPSDFNGVVAGAPSFNHTALTVSRMIVDPILEDAQLSVKQIETLGNLVTKACDGNDGAHDGLIENPLACKVKFEDLLPVCRKPDKDGKCFTSKQVSAVKRLHADTYVNGSRLQPGYPVGSDWSKPNGWEVWMPSADREGAGPGQYFAEQTLRYIAFDKDDPTRKVTDFDAERDMQQFGLAMRLINATDPDISTFKSLGNKLLMYMGWEDLAFSARATVEYYEDLRKKMGETTEEYVRLFMAPGMYHCFGGPGPSNFDYMTPLVAWVEKGIAPDTIIAYQYSGDKRVRSHPLCPWPQVARYKGRGVVEEAESFSCTSPE